MQKCQCCGIEKDPQVLEVYPWSDEDGITERPVPPFFMVEIVDYSGPPTRMCRICHSCYHRLQPDMWSARSHWESLDPVVPFPKLPPHDP